MPSCLHHVTVLCILSVKHMQSLKALTDITSVLHNLFESQVQGAYVKEITENRYMLVGASRDGASTTVLSGRQCPQ
jgi:hypothetical protein